MISWFESVWLRARPLLARARTRELVRERPLAATVAPAEASPEAGCGWASARAARGRLAGSASAA